MDSKLNNEFSYNKNFITEEDVKLIVKTTGHDEADIENFALYSASDKMLGLLAEYWKLNITISYSGVKQQINLFIKSNNTLNIAKSEFVTEFNIFNKEVKFYSILKKVINIPGLKPYCPEFVTVQKDSLILQDLNTLGYQIRNKFKKFDMAHTLEALKTLARFHASSIIFEDKKSKELGKPYTIPDEYECYLDKGVYIETDPRFTATMNNSIEIVKTLSKYSSDEKLLKQIEHNWRQAWFKSLHLTDASPKYKNVICHRDLWNNNLLFHYQKDTEVPDDCILVDFQWIRYQPPAGDVLLLLHHNLDPKFREENFYEFLNFYYKHLGEILCHRNIDIKTVVPLADFIASAEEQRLWGLTVAAYLVPHQMLDDDVTAKIFKGSKEFDKILSEDGVDIIKEVMKSDPRYKKTILDILEEYVERFCL